MGKFSIFIVVIATLELFAYSDYDLDGVEDQQDRCPNSLMSELVDIQGCAVKSLESPHNFDIIVGLEFSQTSYDGLEEADTVSKSVQVDYYYKNLSIEMSTSYYDSQSASYTESGMSDSFLGAFYKLSPKNKLDVRLGAGLILPTYDSNLGNNNTDYVFSASGSYMLTHINIFASYSLTLVGDDDSITAEEQIRYQNTNAYTMGVGFYPQKNLYLAASYNASQSIYQDVVMMETASLYSFYTIDTHWFTTLNYAHGLSSSASDNYVSLRLGYYF